MIILIFNQALSKRHQLTELWFWRCYWNFVFGPFSLSASFSNETPKYAISDATSDKRGDKLIRDSFLSFMLCWTLVGWLVINVGEMPRSNSSWVHYINYIITLAKPINASHLSLAMGETCNIYRVLKTWVATILGQRIC